MKIPIEKFQEQGGRVQTDDLDFDSFRDQPLDDNVLRCIAYMHDIEYQTVLYSRELLMLPQWKDPQFTAFITLWNYEEYWHGQALGRVLEMHGRPAHDERLVAMRTFGKRYLFWSPAIFWLLGHGIRRFPAVHMTWGAINEWTANAAYNRLGQIADHPTLSTLLGRIMRQEGRHAGFYSAWARELLEDDARSRWITKQFLLRQWDIVGNGDVPRSETAFAGAYLFGGDEGNALIDRVEARIDALPGLAGLGLVRTAIKTATDEVTQTEGPGVLARPTGATAA
ncbi:MAG TPA: hypothetical protein PKY13_11370 [Microthrixaceae bacterium]|jgi:hypothetical protein|nr:hypothetical protein [Microthrixaceae bacterium]